MNYYISDLHFGHANIIRFDNRPFSDIRDMDDALIHNWNNAVSSKDTVYILGDFSLSKKEKDWIRILDRLNGDKVLILGNHDLRNMTTELRGRFLNIQRLLEISDLGKHIILCHYPILFYSSSYAEDMWHFCGHTHNHTKEEAYRAGFVRKIIENYQGHGDNRGHIVNVGCMMDYMGYTPRTAFELISWWHDYFNIPHTE